MSLKSPTYLVIDIGNTRVKAAVFDSEDLLFKKVYERFGRVQIEKLQRKYRFRHGIWSTVRSEDPAFTQQKLRDCHLIQMSHVLKLPLENMYKTPETLGPDRLAAVVAAHAMYPGENVLVIDMGTCIKYDFVDARGRYHGGNIAPGLEMRLESMHKMTGKLPRVPRHFNPDMLGKSSKEALQNGAVWGIKLEIENFIKYLTGNWDDIRVILSGGDSIYFGEILESRIFVLPDLILKGLHETLKFNLIDGRD